MAFRDSSPAFLTMNCRRKHDIIYIMFLQLADTIAICRVKLKSAAKSIFYQRVHNRSTGCISIEIVFLTVDKLQAG